MARGVVDARARARRNARGGVASEGLTTMTFLLCYSRARVERAQRRVGRRGRVRAMVRRVPSVVSKVKQDCEGVSGCYFRQGEL